MPKISKACMGPFSIHSSFILPLDTPTAITCPSCTMKHPKPTKLMPLLIRNKACACRKKEQGLQTAQNSGMHKTPRSTLVGVGQAQRLSKLAASQHSAGVCACNRAVYVHNDKAICRLPGKHSSIRKYGAVHSEIERVSSVSQRQLCYLFQRRHVRSIHEHAPSGSYVISMQGGWSGACIPHRKIRVFATAKVRMWRHVRYSHRRDPAYIQHTFHRCLSSFSGWSICH
jgi:hypothetical protein